MLLGSCGKKTCQICLSELQDNIQSVQLLIILTEKAANVQYTVKWLKVC